MEELAEYIVDEIGDLVLSHEIRLGELMLTVQRDRLLQTLTFLRDDSTVDCKILVDVCGVDYPGRPRVRPAAF